MKCLPQFITGADIVDADSIVILISSYHFIDDVVDHHCPAHQICPWVKINANRGSYKWALSYQIPLLRSLFKAAKPPAIPPIHFIGFRFSSLYSLLHLSAFGLVDDGSGPAIGFWKDGDIFDDIDGLYFTCIMFYVTHRISMVLIWHIGYVVFNWESIRMIKSFELILGW